MERSKTFMGVLALMGAGSLFTTGAEGATVSYNGNYGPVAVPFAPTTVASLPLFNPALGTLTKVTLQLDANTSSGTIGWDNEAAVASSVTLGIGASVTATAQTALTAVAIPLQSASGNAAADDDGTPDYLGADSFAVTGGSGFDSDTDVSTLPATLALFTGVGTFPVDVSGSVSTSLSTSGGFGPINPTPGNTDGIVTVTYEYVAVPEPTSVAFAAIAGAGLLARRGRRAVR